MKLLRLMSVFIALIFITSMAYAAEDRGWRPCVTADIVGSWELVSLFGPAKDKASPDDLFFSPYQRFIFEADGSVKGIISAKPFEQKEYETMIAAAKHKTYVVDQNGALIVSDGKNQQYNLCNFILKDQGKNIKDQKELLKGDIVLTIFDSNDKPILGRTIRKMQ